MNAIKGIPYGISDFNIIINENYYFVDKTPYLPLIEKMPSYILELKYAGRTATDDEIEKQGVEGRKQLLQYREDKKAKHLAERTTLHSILIQFQEWDMTRCEEISTNETK